MGFWDLGLSDYLNLGVNAIGVFNELQQDNVNRAKTRQREQFNQALITVQKNALGSKFAMDNYQNLMQENVALGTYASSLSKSRIGVAGTANQGFTSIMGQYQKQRDGLLLSQTEQLAKLQLSELSSVLSQKANRDKSVLDRLGGVGNEIDSIFGGAFSSIANLFRDDSQHLFPETGRQDTYEKETKEIGI